MFIQLVATVWIMLMSDNGISAASVTHATMSDRIYRTIASHQMAFCVQMATANSDRTIGCRSRPAGNLGRVQWLNESVEPGAIGVTGMLEFSRQWRENFPDWRRLNGLIVLLKGDEAAPGGYNLTELADCGSGGTDPTDACVDTDSKLAGVAAHYAIPFPVVLVQTSTLEAATGLSLQQLRQHRRLWAALTFSYSGISNSRSCYSRQKFMYTAALGRYITTDIGTDANQICQLVSEISLAWSVAEMPRSRQRQPASVLLVVTRMDSFSVFSNWQAGAALLQPSLAVMLAFAGALAGMARSVPSDAWKDRDVVLLFLTGESYGHLASRAVADRLLYDGKGGGGGGGLLGGRGQPAGLRADHLHSVIEVGPLGFLDRRRPLWFVGADTKDSLRDFVRGDSNVTVEAATAFPTWAALSVLTSSLRLPGLLLTDLHGNATTRTDQRYADWNSFTDLASWSNHSALAQVASSLTRMAVRFLCDGGGTVGSGDAAIIDDMLGRVERAAACLRPGAAGSGGRRLCRDLADSWVVDDSGSSGGGGGGGVNLARELERWRRSGVDASLGQPPASGRSGGGDHKAEASGMRLLVGAIMLRYTLRVAGSGSDGGDCPDAAVPDEAPVRGYRMHYQNGSHRCMLSSLTSFQVGPDIKFGPAAWTLSVRDTLPSLMLFARQSWVSALAPLALGLVVAALSAHCTANALVYFGSRVE